MEKRVLGRTGHKSTLISLGGAIFIYPVSRAEEDAFITLALDSGVNHIDVAPTYGDAEIRLGRWVKEYRENLFLACKTGKRTREEAWEELRRSLQRPTLNCQQLRTGFLDYVRRYNSNGLRGFRGHNAPHRNGIRHPDRVENVM